MSWTNWKLLNTQSLAGTVGEVAVVTAGRYNFRLTNGRGANYNATYTGAGGGLGAGVRTPGGRIASFIMSFYMPAIRSLVNAVGSQDLYLSNLYSLIDSNLTANNLNHTLYIMALGGEIGAGLSGSLLAWEDTHDTNEISPQLARLGTATPRNRPRLTAMAVAVGVGVGLVGVSATETVCTCNSFRTA